jgi:hypothetical protein
MFDKALRPAPLPLAATLSRNAPRFSIGKRLAAAMTIRRLSVGQREDAGPLRRRAATG